MARIRTVVIVLAVSFLTSIVACNKKSQITDGGYDDIIWDISPYSILMEVTDGTGNNLFDPQTLGNWLDGPVTATFNGVDYPFPAENTPPTKELLVPITGLSVRQMKFYGQSEERTILEFGELNGGDNLTADLKLRWPDGTSDIISIKHTCSYPDGKPKVTTSLYLNGKAVSAPIKLVKN